MWRVIHSVGRGLRSVRPSQCCPQDSSEETPNKYHIHCYQYNGISKAQAATLRHYSAASSWSPLTIKCNDNSLGGITCRATEAVLLCQSSFKFGESIHTQSYNNASPGTERRDITNCHPICPPWHWQILQDNQTLDKHCSEEKEKKREQNTRDWERTCHSQEWKEALQSSPTLHALGWGSAAALTWSLYHDWSEHHPCPYLKDIEQKQTPHSGKRKSKSYSQNVEMQDKKYEETLHYHKPFRESFPFECNSQKGSFKSDGTEDSYKHYSEDINNVPNVHCTFRGTNTYKINLVESHECQAQERIIPIYSLQETFLDVARNVFCTGESDNEREKHRLEGIFKDEDELNPDIRKPFSLEDEWSNTQDKTDSGCISDLNNSFQSQNCTIKLEIARNQYNQNEEDSAIKPVSGATSELPVTKALESKLPPKKEENVSKHHQPTAQNEPDHNSDDSEVKILQDRLLEIMKTHHEERVSDMLKKDRKNLLNANPEEMVVYFQAGVLVGDTTSAFNLALCYHMGHGVTQDLEKAHKLYEVASAAGHGWATYNLAVMLNQGLGGPLLPQKGHNLLLQAAEMGVKEAKDALSVLEEKKQQQIISEEEGEPHLRKCYSEPCLFTALTEEWQSSYSTGDLQALLDEEEWTVDDFCTIAHVSKKI